MALEFNWMCLEKIVEANFFFFPADFNLIEFENEMQKTKAYKYDLQLYGNPKIHESVQSNPS
jgi:hypothetical protein